MVRSRNTKLLASALFALGVFVLVAPAGVISLMNWWLVDQAYHDTYYVVVNWAPLVAQALLAMVFFGAALLVIRKG